MVTTNVEGRREGGSVPTFFASPERAQEDELRRQIEEVSCNSVIDALVTSVSGLLAVLNEHRQIVALNDTLLNVIGVKDGGEVLGLRPGEAIGCVHADELAGGCGTSRYCSTCGTAIAIVSALGGEEPQERICAATVEKGGKKVELCFRVKASPIEFESRRFILLFMQDITSQERRAALERTFFHDLNNTIMALDGMSRLLDSGEISERAETAETVRELVEQLTHEVALQRELLGEPTDGYQPSLQRVTTGQILHRIRDHFAGHPAAAGKKLALPRGGGKRNLTTDITLLMRILTNMLVNAFEATDAGGTVDLWVEEEENGTSFSVRNSAAIPEAVALRVFQRHFSTKEGSGRGIGTYSMKLFGEVLLGGKVDFTSSAAKGTVFRLRLPA